MPETFSPRTHFIRQIVKKKAMTTEQIPDNEQKLTALVTLGLIIIIIMKI